MPHPAETVLARIVAPHFVCGIVIDARTAMVVEVAPIARFMVGKSARWVADYCRRKNYLVSRCSTPTPIRGT